MTFLQITYDERVLYHRFCWQSSKEKVEEFSEPTRTMLSMTGLAGLVPGDTVNPSLLRRLDGAHLGRQYPFHKLTQPRLKPMKQSNRT